MERTYYTLDDIRKAIGISPDKKGPYTMFAASYLLNLTTFMNSCLQESGYDAAPTLTETDESNKCFKEYIWPRFYQEAIIYVDSDETESFVEKFCRTKVGQIMA